jgi:hypothetical protein
MAQGVDDLMNQVVSLGLFWRSRFEFLMLCLIYDLLLLFLLENLYRGSNMETPEHCTGCPTSTIQLMNFNLISSFMDYDELSMKYNCCLDLYETKIVILIVDILS